MKLTASTAEAKTLIKICRRGRLKLRAPVKVKCKAWFKSMIPEYAAVWREWLQLCCTGSRGGSRGKGWFLPELLSDVCISDAPALTGEHRFNIRAVTASYWGKWWKGKKKHLQKGRQQWKQRRKSAETEGDAKSVCVMRQAGGEWVGAKTKQIREEGVEASSIMSNCNRATCPHINFKYVCISWCCK